MEQYLFERTLYKPNSWRSRKKKCNAYWI